MNASVPAGRRIVVGVDGSPSSRRALRWAVEQARATGAVLDAVTSWTYPSMYGYALTAVDPQQGELAAKVLADSVAEVVGDEQGVEVRQTTLLGNAAETLLERARGADMLVLGNRGHGGFAGALLGSVGQHCVQHAPCPVVIVRDEHG